jgi:hypothetical protein
LYVCKGDGDGDPLDSRDSQRRHLFEELCARLQSVFHFHIWVKSRAVFATALAILGRLDGARTAARAALALNPQLTVARFRGFFAHFSDNSINLAVRDRIIEGVRKAGVPEG